MEKENVLEIEFQPVWDKWAWRITKQNEEILKRNNFKDEELNVESFESQEFRKMGIKSVLFIRGYSKKGDNDIQICTTEEKALIEEKVKAINEKYGVPKRWRAEDGNYYYHVDDEFIIQKEVEDYMILDNNRYNIGNYFRTKEEALEYAEYMKQKSLEWHEKRDENE